MKVFTVEDVKKHDQNSDLWMIINGRVYDCTNYAPDHPGGAEVLMTVAGADGTEGFNDIGHSKEAKEQLEGLVIGTVEGAKTMTVVEEAQPQGQSQSSSAKSTAPSTSKEIPMPTHQNRRLIVLAIIIVLLLVLIMYPIDPIITEIERLEQLVREQDSMSTVMNRNRTAGDSFGGLGT
ncbi:cytochrome b5-like heme/steroid binding domain-containing protein [Exophiala viscosa]|uniref:Cytochrome b5-like heme/steroid binding domain-containing protein n=1 Tax=Exophiala viscosa TaxID=2486360 RepID=A0AAN6DYI3_9EURO|nr:cytochrome b5-like heme/steroid binding domain-containing protein [Exophiala viscosa]KAI1624133.1 cytochrome b5-like heme/steroid binding domain-containing protein [Exophiala viscosa]